MKTHKIGNEVVAQGDMLIRRVDKLPEGVKAVKAEGGKFILTHSESGHHHAVNVKEGVTFWANDNEPMKAWLVVDNTKCLVEHERSFDTHAPFEFDSGIYEINRQIESDNGPEGWKRAVD